MRIIESKIHAMLPQSKKLLEEDIIRRRKELTDISKEGAELWEGDQWHSTAYRDQQIRKELAIRYLQLIDQGGGIEVLSKPTQNNIVEIGHMVKVELPDDIDVIEAKIPFSIVHILSEEDTQYFGQKFDGIAEMVVSRESPIGQSVIGLKRGEQSTYLKTLRLKVLDIDDAIKASTLFED